MGLCKCFYRLVRNFLIVFFIVVLLPGLPPKTHFDFQSFIIPKPLDLTGPLEVNNLLDNAERLFEGQVHGPETLLKRGNEIFTSIHGGEVIKITDDHITHVAKFGKPCEGLTEEKICGRPLGLAFDTQGDNLIVADAYYGIWSVNLSNGKKTQLVSPTEELDGKVRRPASIFNSVAVSKSGDIFWTDSASDFKLEDGVYTLLANPSGRLFRYNRVTKQNKFLLDELYFANGIALPPNEDFIVVSETGASRLTRYYLTGAKAGQTDVFIDSLPGIPDNLTPDADGLWVPLVQSVDSENPALWQSAANAPLVRKFLARALALIELPFKVVENIYPNFYTQTFIHKIGHFESLVGLAPARQTILRLDWNGKIIGSLHGFDKSVHGVAHVLEDGDYLYLGSFAHKYLGRVKLPKTYKSAKATPKVAPKVEATTKKPVTTTTTPKPTTTTTTPKTKQTTTTTTTTPKPATTTTPKPTTKSAPKPTTTTPKSATEAPTRKPAPIHENVAEDTKRPAAEKLKVIKKGGAQGEL
ncbi:adipocyte plasma membrane-associated protein Hemomucin [Sitodiplosis mosellana]|uniref:adipocyte plasma membrane-associated protein Hemomucin n=1 Tax=Sitodiplosis mosellana TaxID=263140 RepID=UPI002443C2BE|nr:adipocyte plasma membrane-associated protein Hemomucin [Sitodiplosis mosellana]